MQTTNPPVSKETHLSSFNPNQCWKGIPHISKLGTSHFGAIHPHVEHDINSTFLTIFEWNGQHSKKVTSILVRQAIINDDIVHSTQLNYDAKTDTVTLVSMQMNERKFDDSYTELIYFKMAQAIDEAKKIDKNSSIPNCITSVKMPKKFGSINAVHKN